ncbi:MAG: sensor histidine kinase [Kutzneria sp.]|nr:sensor histidine kinase [Kutzneria sp.]
MSDIAFCHQALLYDGVAQYRDGVASFVRDGLRAGEAVLVAVLDDKVELLRDELGRDADQVRFLDMAVVGRNPARIIPAWRDWVAEHDSRRPFRGVGEPVWPGRSPAELVECHQHESLLNLAFGGLPVWRLLCPYDMAALDKNVIDIAVANHPVVDDRANADYRPPALVGFLTEPLPDAREPIVEFPFGSSDLAALRDAVGQQAGKTGLNADAGDDLMLAAHEAAANSIDHGGGSGLLRMWQDGDHFVCDVLDTGLIMDPFVGRHRPNPHQARGRGLWMANQLCDLVQVRSSAEFGTIVRLRVSIRPQSG